MRLPFVLLLTCAVAAGAARGELSPRLTRLEFNHPGLVVDLGVGLWACPAPMDFDGDGDFDLIVSCPDVPYNGTYFFENPGGDAKYPLFKSAVRIGRGAHDVTSSYVAGRTRILLPGREAIDFTVSGLEKTEPLGVGPNVHTGPVRANQWRWVDFDGDGRLDLVVGVGDWSDYGWDNAFDAQGRWTRGPLHGYVYLLRNTGSDDAPRFDKPARIEAGGRPVDVFGRPSPNLADFDGDGDLDLLCGEFLDKLTYFENVGTRREPQYAAGRFLVGDDDRPLRMDLCMITPVAFDWDRDGDEDLVVGQEDGRVALVEHTGDVVAGLPRFAPPRFFRQEAREVKFGALVTPVGCDFDGDGDEDLLCGNTAGYIGLIENLDGGCPPRFAEPRCLEAAGEVIRIEAGPNGSIQGPCEAKWGYTTLGVADWDHDGRLDVLANSIWGRVVWYRNVGTPREPKLAAAEPIAVTWPGKPPKPAWNWWDPKDHELVTQWRTTPVPVDFDRDGLCDLVMLDHEGYLSWFPRRREGDSLVLLPPRRAFVDSRGKPLRFNAKRAGKSGRRKLCVVDWDGDGRLDVLADGWNAEFWRQLPGDGPDWAFQNEGPMDLLRLAGHDTSPTVVDWNRDGRPELVLGAEDGHLYYLPPTNTNEETAP
ncbi:MAG: VCBS repeat-containing protein [Pirellulales bacterium]|nr:VCBS repeat-containing protein [Pirellulales bacterium]